MRSGEGFVVIARRYRVAPTALARANGLRLTSVLVPGQRLRIPGRTAATKRVAAPKPRPVSPAPTLVHVVQPGEGFIAIAERYGVRPTLLASANGLVLTSVIAPGQRLRIPGRTTATSTPVVKSTVSRLRHTVAAGESFFSISQRYHVSPWRLAQANRLSLTSTIVPGQRLALPPGARLATSGERVDRSVVSAAIDRWAAVYGVDGKLARALGGMESGFQEDVVSSAGAVGVMQLLPETWEWVDTVLLGQRTPRTYDGNVRAGVRYLRWQLDQFGGDVKLALAGYYQGARAVRERGLFDDTKQYVAVILGLRLGLTLVGADGLDKCEEAALPAASFEVRDSGAANGRLCSGRCAGHWPIGASSSSASIAPQIRPAVVTSPRSAATQATSAAENTIDIRSPSSSAIPSASRA